MLSWIRKVMNATKSSRPTLARNHIRLGAELLETRENPSTVELIGSTLQITGTSGMDRVSISIPASGPSAGKLVVEDWIGLGYAYVGISEFNPSAVQAVTFYGYGGDDTLTMNVGGWALEVVAFCGDGNDTVTAGNGDDYLFGEGATTGSSPLTGTTTSAAALVTTSFAATVAATPCGAATATTACSAGTRNSSSTPAPSSTRTTNSTAAMGTT